MTGDDQKVTGDDLRATRDRFNLSQTEMADELGMSKTAYFNLEAGIAAVRPIHVLAMERVSLKIAVRQFRPSLLDTGVRREIDALQRLIGEGIT